MHAAATLRRQELIARKTMEYTDHLASLYTPYTFYGARFAADNTRVSSGLRWQQGASWEKACWQSSCPHAWWPA